MADAVHLEDIPMDLVLEIFPPRGAVGQASSTSALPAPGRREMPHRLPPGGQNGRGPSDASSWQYCFFIRCCWHPASPGHAAGPPSLPSTLLLQALGWTPDTCRDVPDSPSVPEGLQVEGRMQKQPKKTDVCKTGFRGLEEGPLSGLGREW